MTLPGMLTQSNAKSLTLGLLAMTCWLTGCCSGSQRQQPSQSPEILRLQAREIHQALVPEVWHSQGRYQALEMAHLDALKTINELRNAK